MVEKGNDKFKKAFFNLVTLGGSKQLEIAQLQYETAFTNYQSNTESLVIVSRDFKEEMQNLGELTIAAFKALKGYRRIARRRPRVILPKILLSHRSPKSGLIKKSGNEIDRVVKGYSESISTIGSLGAGSAVAVGSWSLVSMLGAASTGTAISTLSGVAATNATWAWFGGGSLLVGGAGMAGGTLVLGAITLVPTIAFASWHSRSKAKDMILETNIVEYESQKIAGVARQVRLELEDAKRQTARITPAALKLIDSFKETKRKLFPYGYASRWSRLIKMIFGRTFFTSQELRQIVLLQRSALTFVSKFAKTD